MVRREQACYGFYSRRGGVMRGCLYLEMEVDAGEGKRKRRVCWGVESYVTALLGTLILKHKQSHTHTHSTAADGQRTEGRS